jgi:cobalt-zinc-cadmium efflux system outer membrane protein
MIARPTAAMLGLLVLARTAVAQPPLALADAQAEARAHAPEAAELDALVRGAEAIAAQAGRRFRQNPELSASYFNGALTGRPEELAWSVGARVPLDLSGSSKPRTGSANADLTRSRLNRSDGLRALDEQVAIAIADVAFQQRLVVRGRRIVDLQTIGADGAHRQLDVGQGTQLEADSADLDLVMARVALAEAGGALAGARARLARLLGRETPSGLVVEDPVEPLLPPQRPDLNTIVDRDPRVEAAVAEVNAATLERETFDRLVLPMPTFGVDVGYTRRDIPIGSFSGTPFAPLLTAVWPDRELVFSVGVPIPVFDRQHESHARSTGRVMMAQAALRMARLTVLSELESTWATFDAAHQAATAVANMPTLIARDDGFVEQAVRAGAFDSLARTQALRRLAETGRTIDSVIHEYRVARAAWIRRSLP